MAAVLAGLLVVPAGATAFADRDGASATPAEAGADAGDALQRNADETSGKPAHDHSTHEHTPVSTEDSIAAAAQNAVNEGEDLGRAPSLPPGFADVEVIGHISEAIAVAFAPTDGTAFVALKTGEIKSFDYNTGTGTFEQWQTCLLYTSPSPRDRTRSRMPSSA